MNEPTEPKRTRAPRKTTAAKPEEAPAEDVREAPAPPLPDPEVVPAGTAWVRVMRDTGAIGKDSRNKDQNFNFRGIDATMNTVGPALRAHGAAVLPVRVEILESERYATSRGTQMHGMITRHDWLILGPDGDVLTYPDGSPIFMQTLGQAADAGDKVASKASSVAYRTALLQSLTVPTGDRDPDADAHERAAQAEPDPRQEWWAKILEAGRAGGHDAAAIRAHYLEKMGHVIDGPQATVATLEEYLGKLTADFDRQRAEAAQAAAEGDQRPGAERDSSAAPDFVAAETAEAAPAEDPTSPEPPAAAANATEPTEPAPAATRTPDPRQALWDDILRQAVRLKWNAEQVRADFRVWSTDAAGGPVEIDGPGATSDILTRYSHVIRARAEGEL